MVKISCKIREYLLNKYNSPTYNRNGPTDTFESFNNVFSIENSQRQILNESYPGRFGYETTLYEKRCQCHEKRILSRDDSHGFSQDRNIQIALGEYVKKRNLGTRSQPKLLQYPELDPELALDETRSKIFQIKCEKKLSSIAKLVLNSFQNKYIYYAIDDILYLFQLNPMERNNLLTILYAPVLSLHNSSSINFFDIWINQIYINEGSKVNKFLKNDCYNLETYSYITIKFLYKKGVPVKKVEPLW